MATEELRKNAILAKLPPRELKQLQESLQILETDIRLNVYEPGKPIKDVYFPLSAIFSLVAISDGRAGVEVATTGREGMVGLPVFLGTATSPHAAFCQIKGAAARLPVDVFRNSLSDSRVLHRALNRFTHSMMVQVAQNVVCNNSHSTVRRAARWLLTTHDRVARDEFGLTQEFMAQMLGVRRPTVSETARRLQSQGYIRYSRGMMTIVDRRGLEKASCQCYSIVKAEFDALVR
jgi:CRP-like cAMP-binding protein